VAQVTLAEGTGGLPLALEQPHLAQDRSHVSLVESHLGQERSAVI
jgi:hypothetical protein